MNSNKKLVKKLFPAVLAAAITVSGVTVPVKANTTVSNGIAVKQLHVLAATDIATATVKLKDSTKYIYNGASQTLDIAKLEVKVGDTTLTPRIDYNISGNTATDAGDHIVTITGAGNYNGSVSYTWKIEPKETTFKLKDGVKVKDKTYDGNKNAELEGATPVVEFDDATVKALSPATPADYTLAAEFDNENVGENKVVTVKVNPVTQNMKNYTFKPVTLMGKIVKSTPVAPANVIGNADKDDTTNPHKRFKYTITAPAQSGSKYQYKIKGTNDWNETGKFFDLDPKVSYTFVAREKETVNSNAGAEKESDAITFTKVANNESPALTYSVITQGDGKKTLTINTPADADSSYKLLYSFNTDDANSYKDVNVKKDLEANATVKIGIRYAETDTENAGTEAKVTVDLAKSLDGVAPVVTGERVRSGVDTFKYVIKSPVNAAGKTYEYSYDGGNTYVDKSTFEGHPFNKKVSTKIYAREFTGNGANKKVGAAGYVEEKFDLIPRLDTDPKAPEFTLQVADGTLTKTKKVTAVPTAVANEAFEYKFGNDGIWGDSNNKDNIADGDIVVYVRFKEKDVYQPSKAAYKYIVLNANKILKGFDPEVAAANSTPAKTDDTKKDNPKKDDTKKPDDTKKSDDTKKDGTKTDNNTTKPANVDKTIKDAFKKSTKSGSVSLTGIGSALKKAVGENAASLSVNLKTSKTKATAASVTKKLKGSKLVKNTVYSLNVKSGATNLTDKQVSGSKIKVTLKVSLGNKNRTVYVMDVSTGKRVKAKYNAKTKKITFTTANVGDFVIVNKAK